MFAGHPLSSLAADAAEVSYVAAAVCFCVGVNALTIESGLGISEPVIVTHHRRSVHHKGDDVAIARFAQERNDAVLSVVKIDPIKSVIAVVLLPQRGFV